MSSQTPLRRVLVTGGAGYIGSHIVINLLLTRRYKVVSIDNHHNSYPEALKRVSEIALDELPPDASEQDRESAQVDAYSGDLAREDQVRAIFERYGQGGFWGVIHVAAYKAVGESSIIPLTYYTNNVSATVLLARVMSDYGCTRLVYSSSATVYGTPPIIPIPETTLLKADSVYGRTKVMCETILQDLCHSEPDRWRVISLRYFNPAGAHPSGRIGEDPKGRPGNLLPLLSQMAVGRVKDPVLKVFGNDFPTHDGTCVRDYLHVMDLASGHLLALDALESPNHVAFQNLPDVAKYKAYNLGRGRGQSVFDIVRAMTKATGYDYKTEVVGRRLGDVPDLTADPALAEKELGFHAGQSLEVACRDLWNWQVNNPQGYSTPQAHNSPSSTVGSHAGEWADVPALEESPSQKDRTTASSISLRGSIPLSVELSKSSSGSAFSSISSTSSMDDDQVLQHDPKDKSGVSTPTAVSEHDGDVIVLKGGSPIHESHVGKVREIKREDVFLEEGIKLVGV